MIASVVQPLIGAASLPTDGNAGQLRHDLRAGGYHAWPIRLWRLLPFSRPYTSKTRPPRVRRNGGQWSSLYGPATVPEGEGTWASATTRKCGLNRYKDLRRRSLPTSIYRRLRRPFCLHEDRARENLHEPLREDALRYFKKRGWHDGIEGAPGNHLCCSQSCSVNFWFQFVRAPLEPRAVLREIGFDVDDVLPITEDEPLRTGNIPKSRSSGSEGQSCPTRRFRRTARTPSEIVAFAGVLSGTVLPAASG